ncbi:MAG: hypothetical protein AVDCRST_MAG65-370 [uncultured Solirubrobacteraceae bacterium]|uniref:Uncharacterized protein n=1 Tax=uncultured Solirubrobacteraceae bacterium TaxID=1162706 RepID=A0A6J4R7Z7_9ACTN|nr:MAG: hypothetical protein AVDCRST_MAG65-370 [uncultured Solirubrobacteraceae bacterium]
MRREESGVAPETTSDDAKAQRSGLTRVVLAVGILVVCAVVALLVVVTARDAPGPTGAVE